MPSINAYTSAVRRPRFVNTAEVKKNATKLTEEFFYISISTWHEAINEEQAYPEAGEPTEGGKIQVRIRYD